MMHSSKMHSLVHLLCTFLLLPSTIGFVSSMAACRRLGGTRIRGVFGRSTGEGASSSVGRYRKSATHQHAIPRMGDRVTDGELEAIRLDPSTLDESEQKRLQALRDLRMKMGEVAAKKRELATDPAASARRSAGAEGASRESPVQATGASAATQDFSGMSDEERKRAESFASIERNLAEVSEIQRKLGITTELEERDLEVVDTDWSGQAGMDQDLGDGGRNWGDLSSRKWLAIGDVAALTMFAYVGRASHGDGAFDFDVLATAFPFVAGWIVASPLLGAYTFSATTSVGDATKSLVPAWGVSIPLGLAIRAFLLKGGEMPPVPFVVTSMIFTFVALGAWRAMYTVVNPTGTGEYKKAGLLDGFRMITTLLNRW